MEELMEARRRGEEVVIYAQGQTRFGLKQKYRVGACRNMEHGRWLIEQDSRFFRPSNKLAKRPARRHMHPAVSRHQSPSTPMLDASSISKHQNPGKPVPLATAPCRYSQH